MDFLIEPIDYSQFDEDTVKLLQHLRIYNVINTDKFPEFQKLKGYKPSVASIFVVGEGFGSYDYFDKELKEDIQVYNGTLQSPDIPSEGYVFGKILVRQCEAVTKSGTRCTRNAIAGKHYCTQHQKIKDKEKEEQNRRIKNTVRNVTVSINGKPATQEDLDRLY